MSATSEAGKLVSTWADRKQSKEEKSPELAAVQIQWVLSSDCHQSLIENLLDSISDNRSLSIAGREHYLYLSFLMRSSNQQVKVV